MLFRYRLSIDRVSSSLTNSPKKFDIASCRLIKNPDLVSVFMSMVAIEPVGGVTGASRATIRARP
jgi:hypothetical protein